MHLTEKTVAVLKNFASINGNVVFRGDNILRTSSEALNVVGKATLDEYPEQEVGIYDLHEFLGTLALVDSPELKFNKDHMLIAGQSGRSRIKYFYSNPEILTSPEKDIKMPSSEVTFTLDGTTLDRLRKAASTLGHVEMAVTVKDDVLMMEVVDPDNSTSNTFSIDIAGSYESDDFKFIFQIANLKFMPGDYDVVLSKRLIAHFTHTTQPLEYWVAMEKTSEYK